MFGGGMFVGWIVLVGIVLLVVWLFRSAFGRAGRRGGPERRRDETAATRILEERFARGEIDKREFEERKRELGKGR